MVIIFFSKQSVLLLFFFVGVGDSADYSEGFTPVAVDPDKSVALVLYSSGTTGLPKGVMISHSNVTSMFELIR